jgi:hypothetical protein
MIAGFRRERLSPAIMNYTVVTNQNGDIIQEASPCKLNVDDIIALMAVNNL